MHWLLLLCMLFGSYLLEIGNRLNCARINGMLSLLQLPFPRDLSVSPPLLRAEDVSAWHLLWILRTYLQLRSATARVLEIIKTPQQNVP